MQVSYNASLKKYNTFGIDASAKELITLETIDDIEKLFCEKDFSKEQSIVLGGGSNLLFQKDFDGVIIKINFKGIDVIEKNDEYIIVESAAGESWDDLVSFCVDNEFYGVENLTYIPGNVGASPVQNIGAYGVELKDVFYSLVGFNLITKEKVEFQLNDCRFGYRDSIFKRELSNKILITSVRIKLSSKKKYNRHYRALKEKFGNVDENILSIKKVSEAVKSIRESKLPDYHQLGNAGSFFKNPEINEGQFVSLKSEFPSLVAFNMENGNYKLAAAWLIEQCGFKGKRKGNVGCYEKQPLVIVNYGNANGIEIKSFADAIQESVYKKFGVTIIPEVNII